MRAPMTIAFVLFALLAIVTSLLARAQATAAPPARYLQVSAPLAQKLVLQAKADHPEIKKIGLHAVPPGGSESVIIANAIPSKIGKVSSTNDLAVVTTGTAKVYPHPEEGGFFDLGMPMFDATHRPIGMMVMEIPYKDAPAPETALALGEKIRDEIAAKIPNKDALFRASSQ